jgi:hypothetical protein
VNRVMAMGNTITNETNSIAMRAIRKDFWEFLANFAWFHIHPTSEVMDSSDSRCIECAMASDLRYRYELRIFP